MSQVVKKQKTTSVDDSFCLILSTYDNFSGHNVEISRETIIFKNKKALDDNLYHILNRPIAGHNNGDLRFDPGFHNYICKWDTSTWTEYVLSMFNDNGNNSHITIDFTKYVENTQALQLLQLSLTSIDQFISH